MTVREAISDAQREAYRETLSEILENIRRANVDADRQTVELFSELRQTVVARIAELGDSPSVAMYQRTLEGIDTSIREWAEVFGVRLEFLQAQGFDIGAMLVSGPLAAAGADVAIGALGPGTDMLRVLGSLRQDLVAGVSDDLRKRIRMEIAGVATGAQTASDAVAKIGRNLTDRNHFSTITHRARAIVVTEVGRAQALASQAAQTAAAEQIPGLRKRWINAHLPGARETHLAVEAATRPGGDPGPIPVDEVFTVAGEKALYPRDPSLSAKESVNCHCVTITVIADSALAKAGEPVVDNDEEPIELAGPDTPDDLSELTPAARRRVENRERVKRLEAPLTPPREWYGWPKTKRLRWLEDEMGADWPIGEEWVDEVTSQRTELVEMPSGRKRRRTFRDRVPTAGIGADLPTTFDLKGMDPDVMLPNMNELRRLGSRYPEVAERLSYVGGYRDAAKAGRWKPRGRGRQFGANTYAHATGDGRNLAYNASKYADGEQIRQSLVGDTRTRNPRTNTFFHPSPAVESVTTHEFGHHVDFWIRRNAQADLFGFGTMPPATSGPGQPITSFSDIWSAFVREHGIQTGGQRKVSTYAGQSLAEGFAETFAAFELRQIGRDLVDLDGSALRWIDDVERFVEGLRDLGLDDRPRLNVAPTGRVSRASWEALSPEDKVAYYRRQNEIIDKLGLRPEVILPRSETEIMSLLRGNE